MNPGYSISKAAQLSGLTPFLIRAWENRYSVVVPHRNEGGQRRYSDTDVERLCHLSRLVEQGRRIGDIAFMDDDALRRLLADQGPPVLDDLVERAMAYIEAFDTAALQSLVESTFSDLPGVDLADRFIFPLMEEVGRSWHESRVEILHEHMASTIIRAALGQLVLEAGTSVSAPAAIVAVPPGQQHDLGAMCCSLALADAGWRPCLLGTHIPADQMLKAVESVSAQALLLSIVFPGRKAPVAEALDQLESDLPENVLLLVGGVSASSYLSGSRGRAEMAPRSMRAFRDRLAR